jgi:L-malate glycosyltransferase
MKRLLLITERFPPDLGGVARSAARIAASLGQLEIAVDVVTWSRFLQPGEVAHPEKIDPEPERVDLEPEKIDPGKVEAKQSQIYRIGLYRQWDMTLLHTLNLLDWLHQTQNYSAVWGHYLFPAGFLATWFGQLYGVPQVVSARGNDIDRLAFPPGDFARLQWTLTQANCVTAVSQDIARKIAVISQRQDVRVLKNAVDTQIFAPSQPDALLRATLGIAPDEVVLGFSGELREKKGQTFLLKALTTVRSHRPACLLLLGDIRPSTQTLLHSYGLVHPEDAQRILITGYCDDPALVAQRLQLCDIYLQPSLWDGMPNALLEAMACGCCCIASDAGGIPEVMDHGQQGFLLPRAQLHHLGEAILELLALDPAERQAIGAAARDRVCRDFSLAQEQQQLQALIAQIESL